MHRESWLFTLALAACGFDGASVPVDAAAADGDDPEDAMLLDARQPLDAPPGCKLWSADFATDPTTLDDNGDGQPDWNVRVAQSLPGQLDNGVWRVDGLSSPLDTNPKHDFLGTTTVQLRMRCVEEGALCATMFANVGYNDGDSNIGGLYVDVRREGANQAVVLNQRRNGMGPLELDRTVYETHDFIDIVLAIDEPMSRLTLELPQFGYQKANAQYAEIFGMGDDRYVSLFAGRDAEFDAISVTSCPP